MEARILGLMVLLGGDDALIGMICLPMMSAGAGDDRTDMLSRPQACLYPRGAIYEMNSVVSPIQPLPPPLSARLPWCLSPDDDLRQPPILEVYADLQDCHWIVSGA